MSKKLLEANFQKRLIKDLKEQGWKALKLQSGMGYTVLDVFATHPEFGSVWIELKTLSTVNSKIGLSALQRREMEDLQKHGTLALCVVGIRGKDQEEFLYVTSNAKKEKLDDEYPEQIRKYGERWDGRLIGRRCNSERERLNIRR